MKTTSKLDRPEWAEYRRKEAAGEFKFSEVELGPTSPTTRRDTELTNAIDQFRQCRPNDIDWHGDDLDEIWINVHAYGLLQDGKSYTATQFINHCKELEANNE